MIELLDRRASAKKLDRRERKLLMNRELIGVAR
jgi:hypothetical protein